ncbi:MAG: 3-keto-5-aminohexanoate cleavage protein [Acidimicrobiia bacterium]
MRLDDKVIIEVGINENQLKSTNANIPYTDEEIAADAQRCLDAGASVIHYHGRDPIDASMSCEAELNIAIQRAITERTTLIAYPTYGDVVPVMDGHYEICTPSQNRFRHLVEAVGRDVRLEIGPIDLGAFYDVNAVRTGIDVPGEPVSGWTMVRGHQINNGYDHVWLARFCEEHGLVKSFAAPDSMCLLNLRNMIDMGLVPEAKLSLKLFFFGGTALPTRFRYMLELARELFTDKQLRWMPVVQATDGFPVAALALAQGGDARTGLGDYAYGSQGAPSNPALVERLVNMARALGREPATPDEARQIKGLAPIGELLPA